MQRMPSLRHTFPKTRNSKVESLSWYLPGPCHTGASAALGARVCSQTPAGVHRVFQNASTGHRIQCSISILPNWEPRSGLRLLARRSTSKSRGLELPSFGPCASVSLLSNGRLWNAKPDQCPTRIEPKWTEIGVHNHVINASVTAGVTNEQTPEQKQGSGCSQ